MQREIVSTWRNLCLGLCLVCLCGLPVQAAGQAPETGPITLRTMGSLFFGGTVTKTGDGGTFHGDHGYAQFYIPQDSRKYGQRRLCQIYYP